MPENKKAVLVNPKGIMAMPRPVDLEESVGAHGLSGGKGYTLDSQYDNPEINYQLAKEDLVNERRGQLQDNLDKLGNASLRFASRVGTAVADGTAGFLYGLSKYTWNTMLDQADIRPWGEDKADATQIFNNELSQELDQVYKNTQEALPLYSTKHDQETTGFARLGQANTWFGDVTDALGFTTASILTGKLGNAFYSNLAKLAASDQAIMKQALKEAAAMENAADKLKVVEKAAKTIKLETAKRQLFVGTLSAQAESGMEARESGQAFVDDTIYKLTHDIQGNPNGRILTDDEIHEIYEASKDVQKLTYALNLPLTGGANALMYGKSMWGTHTADQLAYKELKNVAKSLTKQGEEYALKAATPLDKGIQTIKNIGRFVENPIEEMVQEHSQLVASKGSQDFYSKQFNKESKGTVGDFINSFVEANNYAMDSEEGFQSRLIGAVTGFIGGNAKILIGGKPEAIKDWNKETKIKQAALATINKYKTSEVFKESLKSAIRHTTIVNEQNQALENNDMFGYQNAQQELITNYVLSRIKTGKVKDLYKDLESLKDMSAEEFEKYVGVPIKETNAEQAKANLINLINDRIEKVKQIEKLNDEVNLIFPKASQGNKERLINAGVNIMDAKKRRNKLANEIYNEIVGDIESLSRSTTLADISIDRLLNITTEKDVKNFKFGVNSSNLSPVTKDKISTKLEDIKKLAVREKEFANLYNDLKNPTTQVKKEAQDNKKEENFEKELTNEKPVETEKTEPIDSEPLPFDTKDSNDSENPPVNTENETANTQQDQQEDDDIDNAVSSGTVVEGSFKPLVLKSEESQQSQQQPPAQELSDFEKSWLKRIAETNDFETLKQDLEQLKTLESIHGELSPVITKAFNKRWTELKPKQSTSDVENTTSTTPDKKESTDSSIYKSRGLNPGLQEREEEWRKKYNLPTGKKILDFILGLLKQKKDFTEYIQLQKVKSNTDNQDIIIIRMSFDGGTTYETIGNLQRPDKLKTSDPEIIKLYNIIESGKKYNIKELNDLGVKFILSKGELAIITDENHPGTLLKDIDPDFSKEYYIYDTKYNEFKNNKVSDEAIDLVSSIPKDLNSRYVAIYPNKELGNKFLAVYPSKADTLDPNFLEDYIKDLDKKSKEIQQEPNENKRKSLADKLTAELKDIYISLKDSPGYKISISLAGSTNNDKTGGIKIVLEKLENNKYVNVPATTGRNFVILDSVDSIDDIINVFNENYTKEISKDSFKISINKKGTMSEESIGTNFSAYIEPSLVKNRNLRVEFDTNKFNENSTKVNTQNPATVSNSSITESKPDSNTPNKEASDLVNKISELKSQLGKSRESDIKLREEIKKLQDEIDNYEVNKIADPSITEILTQEEIDAVQSILPDFIKIEDIAKLKLRLNQLDITWGAFKNNIIYLNEVAGKGTAKHEAFHAVFRVLLTDKEITNYLKLAKKEMNLSKSELESEKNKLRKLYPYLNETDLENLVYEEYMADKFMGWKINKSVNTNSIFKGFFKKIVDYFKGLFNRDNSIDALFDKIATGYFKSSTAKQNRFTKIKSEVYKSLPSGQTTIISKDGTPINVPKFLTLDRSLELINTVAVKVKNFLEDSNNSDNKLSLDELAEKFIEERIDALYSNEAFDYIESKNPIEKKRLEDLKNSEIETLYNEEARAIIKSEVKNKILKARNIINANIEAEQTEEQETGAEALFNKAAWEKGGEDSLGILMKEYLEFASYLGVDEITGTVELKAIDTRKLYNGLARGLTGVSEDQILQRLTTLAQDNPNINGFLEMLMKDTGMAIVDGELTTPIKNQNLLQQFIVNFRKYKSNQLFIDIKPSFSNNILNENEVKVINANTNNPAEIQIVNWNANYDSIREQKEFLISEIGNISNILLKLNNSFTSKKLEDSIKLVKEHFNNLGIELSSGYIRYFLASNIKEENRTNKIKKDLESVGELPVLDFNEVFFNVAKDLINNNISWYDDKKGIRNRLKELANTNAMFDESIGNSTYKNAENKTVHEIIDGSYVLEETTKINNPAYRNKINKDSYLKNNYLLQSFNKFLNNISVNILDGLRDTSKDGTPDQETGITYSDFGVRESVLASISLFLDQKVDKITGLKTAAYIPRLNEASSTAYIVRMPVQKLANSKNKASAEAVDIIYDTIFTAEKERIEREWKKATKTGEFVPGNKVKYNDSPKGRAFSFTELNYLENYLGKERYNSLIEAIKNEQSTEDYTKSIKEAIENYLNDSIQEYLELLHENGIISLGDTDRSFVNYNNILPTGLSQDNRDYKNYNELLSEYFLNDYIMSFSYNQLLDGDYAKSRKDKQDIIKRNKSGIGSGPNLGAGEHTVSYIKSVNAYIISEKNGIRKITDESLILKKLKDDGTLDYLYVLEQGKEVKVEKIETNDGQSYNSIYHKMFILNRLGKLDNRTKEIYKKILQFTYRNKKGEVIRDWNISQEDLQYLFKTSSSLNPDKTLTFGKEILHKTSEATLVRGAISYIADEDVDKFIDLTNRLLETTDEDTYKALIKEISSLYKPLHAGTAYHHNLANQMDKHGIDQIVTESASKGETLTPEDSLSNTMDLSKSSKKIPNRYKREQMATPTGKKEIVDPTQLIQLIDSDQEDSTSISVSFNESIKNIGQLRELYRGLLADTRNNSFRIAARFMKADQDSNKTDLYRLAKILEKTITISGGDSFSTEMFSVNDTTKKSNFNWNLQSTKHKAEEILLAHFSKGTVSQKVNGTKVSLISSVGVGILRDSNNKVVLRKTVAKNPEKYQGKGYTSSALKHNVKDENGNLYSECILSEAVMTKYGLKIGDTIPVDLAEMLGVRIPTDDFHSMISLRVVDFLPNYMEGSGMFPDEIIYLSGADFDIDSLFIHSPAFYINSKGKPVKYGTEKTLEEKYEGFKNYLLNDKNFSTRLKTFIEENNPEYYKNKELQKTLNLLDAEDFILSESIDSKNAAIFENAFNKTLDYFNFPTTKEEYAKTKNLNNAELNNKILEARIKFLTNSHVQEEKAHSKTSTDPFKELADELNSILPAGKQLSEKYRSASDAVGKLKAREQMVMGSQGIGIVANSLQLFTLLSKNNTSINKDTFRLKTVVSKKDSEGKKLLEKINYTVEKFRKSKTGERIIDIMGSLLNVMTDNGKDPIAGKLKLRLNLLNTFNMLLLQGINKTHAAYILNSPAVQNYAKDTASNKYGVKTKHEERLKKYYAVSEAFKKYMPGVFKDDITVSLKTIDELIKEDSESKENKYAFFTEPLDIDQVEELLKQTLSKEEADKLNAQILYSWLKIEEQAETLKHFNSFLKLNKGFPAEFYELSKDMEDALTKLGLKEAFNIGEDSDAVLPVDTKAVLNGDKATKRNVELTLGFLDKLAPHLLIEQTKSFKHELNKLFLNIKESKVNKDLIKEVSSDFLGFLSIKAYKKFLQDLINSTTKKSIKNVLLEQLTSIKGDLLFSALNPDSKTVAREIFELQTSEDENISKNYFVRYLTTKFKFIEDEEGGQAINTELKGKVDLVLGRSFVKESPKVVENLVDGFKQLYFNPETKHVAIHLFNYLLVKDNSRFKAGSFVKAIAPFMYTQLSAGIDNLASEMIKDNPNLTKIVGQSLEEASKEFRAKFNMYKPHALYLNYRKNIGLKDVKDVENKEVHKGLTKTTKDEIVSIVFDINTKNSGVEIKEIFSYLHSIFESKKVKKDGKEITLFKFPEYYRFEGKLFKLTAPLDSNGEFWNQRAEYTDISNQEFGYKGVSPYPLSIEENLSIYEKTQEATKNATNYKKKDVSLQNESEEDVDLKGAIIPESFKSIETILKESAEKRKIIEDPNIVEKPKKSKYELTDEDLEDEDFDCE